ncbi:LysE/ArgO family amino acid transporter [Nocardioides bruguierae]|uniref:LysE/ArgO family amino acid transporter n=1 Tax=Nocardioides bruguierae TaxID=2945102 RepID=UPI0020222F1F|nr:LysE/ArgO family amino acid transporter [Nocardioides bruguierae]MCL8024006.1 LysE/ArgO family amino acid transporter [Nocardioides bruguierae]
MDLLALAAGLLAGLSLIVAIGSQNAFVLRQGLRREHVGAVVVICTLSDVVLILAGVGGVGALVSAVPWLITLIRWLGVAFLVGYALLSFRRAWAGGEALAAGSGVGATLSAVVVQALALTWLNPHVYLDTVLLLGSLASSHGHPGRWWFAGGAMVGSAIWFTGLGYGARFAGRLFARPVAWRVLDTVIGLTMLAIAASLALGA